MAAPRKSKGNSVPSSSERAVRDGWFSTYAGYTPLTATSAWWNLSAAGWLSRWAFSPKKPSLTTLTPHLINFYRWVKKGLRIEIPLANDASLYYQHRDRFNELIRKGLADTHEAAQLFFTTSTEPAITASVASIGRGNLTCPLDATARFILCYCLSEVGLHVHRL